MIGLATKGILSGRGGGSLLETLPPAIWNYLLTAITTSGSIGKHLKDKIDFIESIHGGRWIRDGVQYIFYRDDNITEVARYNLFKRDGTPAGENDEIFEAVRV